MFSQNGCAEELENLLPYVRAKGAYIVAATAQPESTLGRLADLHVTVPYCGELSPFRNANRDQHRSPAMTYNIMQMLFGDTCAVYLMELKGLIQEQYALNHPAGRIGKRLVLTVEEVMIPWQTLPLVSPEDLGLNTLVHMAGASKGCGCLLVTNEKRQLIGTFADADLRRALAHTGEEVLRLRVKDLMNFGKDYPRTISISALAYDAQRKMEEGNPVDYLPVISDDDEEKLLGLVTTNALARAGL